MAGEGALPRHWGRQAGRGRDPRYAPTRLLFGVVNGHERSMLRDEVESANLDVVERVRMLGDPVSGSVGRPPPRSHRVCPTYSHAVLMSRELDPVGGGRAVLERVPTAASIGRQLGCTPARPTRLLVLHAERGLCSGHGCALHGSSSARPASLSAGRVLPEEALAMFPRLGTPGGEARKRALSAAERSARARKAVPTRWNRRRQYFGGRWPSAPATDMRASDWISAGRITFDGSNPARCSRRPRLKSVPNTAPLAPSTAHVHAAAVEAELTALDL
jgi:hypothetical protein